MKKRASGKARGKTSRWQGSAVISALLKLGVVLVLFFLSRIFFYLFNLKYFSGIPFPELGKIFLAGIRFDLSAILILNAPFLLMNLVPFRFRYHRVWQGVANGYFYFINILGLTANFIDLIYFRFTLKRTTGDIFKYLGVGGDFNKLVPQFLHDFWYVLLLLVAFAVALVWLARRFRVTGSGPSRKKGFAYWGGQLLVFAMVGFLAVIGIRGGFQLRPISIITAGNYTTSKYVPLLLNTPFSIAKTLGHESLQTRSWYRRESDLAGIYSPVHKGKNTGFRDLNVMIIILESFSAEHIGALNRNLEHGNYKGFTPFLDSLIGQGLVFHAFANSKTSIQGVPAILSGIPSLMNESYIQSPYSADKINSLASLLKAKGYTSAFFHGGTNGTMGFDSYMKFAGFDRYYGRTEYHNEKDYDGKWGIRDEEFLQFTARTLNTLPQPFLGAVFSLSSHHPYYVPEKYRHLFRTGPLPIQQSIMYTD
ncbi:MAG TPA: sulfatase-like hydrolase/transferase [Bacteroidales bacterium]|nr:sulfatase-like hydrolase/transferase [Bacteroidales bacterium]